MEVVKNINNVVESSTNKEKNYINNLKIDSDFVIFPHKLKHIEEGC